MKSSIVDGELLKSLLVHRINLGFTIGLSGMLTVVGTASGAAPGPFVADHVPYVDPARPDALRERGKPEEVLVAVDVDEHGHPAEVGLEGVN